MGTSKTHSAKPDRGVSASKRVEAHLRKAIHAGKLRPRQRIIEEDLARELEVSRGPVREALLRLERDGYSAAGINPRFVKPLDKALIERYARQVGLFVTFEDHVLMGGFGSAVLECLSELGLDVPVVRIGWPDEFIDHGKVEALREKYGLTAEAALEKARPFLAAMESRRMVLR